MPVPARALALSALLLVQLSAVPAAALVIDSFEVGDFVVGHQGVPILGPQEPPFTYEWSGYSTSEVIGGARWVRVVSYGTDNEAFIGLSTSDEEPDNVGMGSISYSPPDGRSADFALGWDGLGSGSPDGSDGGLALDLTGFSSIVVDAPVAEAAPTLQLTLYTSVTEASVAMALIQGTNAFALSGFGVLDLADIQAIRLDVIGLIPNSSVQFASVRAVPEPSTALLLAAGLAGLAAKKQR